MSGYRSPRQRRDAHRRRRQQRQQRQLAEFREQIAATRPVTPAGLLAQEFGVDVAPWQLRGGRGVCAAWPGGRIVGTLAAVRAELERTLPRLQPPPVDPASGAHRRPGPAPRTGRTAPLAVCPLRRLARLSGKSWAA